MENEEYENKMLEAFIQKPEVFQWYKRAFSKYNINGIKRMAWVWSWWAFGGGIFYLLYRKTYLAALLIFLVSVITSKIPFIGILISIFLGGFGVYFVYLKYQKIKQDIETTIKDNEKRIETMQQLGGYNNWAIWIGGILSIIAMISLILYFAVLFNVVS